MYLCIYVCCIYTYVCTLCSICRYVCIHAFLYIIIQHNVLLSVFFPFEYLNIFLQIIFYIFPCTCQTCRGRRHDFYAAACIIEEVPVRDHREAPAAAAYGLPHRKRAQPDAVGQSHRRSEAPVPSIRPRELPGPGEGGLDRIHQTIWGGPGLQQGQRELC